MKPLLFLLLTVTAGCYERKVEHKSKHLSTSPDFDKGESFYYEKKDSAFYYLNRAITNLKDSLQIAMAYNYMGVIQLQKGDYFGSQESLLESLKYLDEKKKEDSFCLSSDYSILGNNSLNLKKYDEALRYYNVALNFANAETLELYSLNNKAVAYQKKGEYPLAIAIYASIKDRRKNNKEEYSRILSNLAFVKWLHDSSYRALPEFMEALAIRLQEKDDWGLNASYSHISDYYRYSKPDSALYYAQKMYKTAQRINSPDDIVEALQKLILLSNPTEIRKYFTRYQQLNDSIQVIRNAAKNQFALIRFETEKNKSVNLSLQKDNAEKRFQLIQQRILLYSILLLSILAAIFAIIWYRKRKRQLERESLHRIREQELRTSQKVHDVVANGLYRIMTELEQEDSIQKERLADKIEDLYERSRDISYEQPLSSSYNFQAEINNLLMSFVNASTKVVLVGNHDETWIDITGDIKEALQTILQELMVNMKKHSHAQNVVIKFERINNQLRLNYKDDGVGLSPSFRYGNGLTNTENRIKQLGGRIIFDRASNKGLSIRIYFPVT